MLNSKFGTAAEAVDTLRDKLHTAGLHELGTRLRGITVENTEMAVLVRTILQRSPVPLQPDVKEWWSITLQNIERALQPEFRAAA